MLRNTAQPLETTPLVYQSDAFMKDPASFARPHKTNVIIHNYAIPNDILFLILILLSSGDLGRLARVNKAFYSQTQDNNLWKRKAAKDFSPPNIDLITDSPILQLPEHPEPGFYKRLYRNTLFHHGMKINPVPRPVIDESIAVWGPCTGGACVMACFISSLVMFYGPSCCPATALGCLAVVGGSTGVSTLTFCVGELAFIKCYEWTIKNEMRRFDEENSLAYPRRRVGN